MFAAAPANGHLRVEVPDGFRATPETVAVEGLKVVSISASPSPCRRGFTMLDAALAEEPVCWNEFHPRLYTLVLRDDAADFTHRIRFGFRTVGTDGHLLTLNGVRIFTRGNVENANFAKDGIPWMEDAEWLRVFRTLKEEDGVNAIRFHTWCPPAAAFRAADELGMLLHPEAGIWTDAWMGKGDEVGNGKPVDGFVRRELKAIADAYGNSPSFTSLTVGNELGNSNFETMGKWVAEHKKYDPRALCYASSARKLTPADDFSLSHRVPDKGLAREKLMPRTDWDYEGVYSAAKIPTVAHEIGQWPVYPIWDELFAPFTGTMRPWNLTRHRDTAARKGTLRFQREYHAASAKLNRLIYKEEVESFLRTPSCAGLQLLEVQDYTGQAEALVGWRDPFYALKTGFKGLAPFSTVWGPVCYLARFPRFTYVVGETYRAELAIRNLTEKPLAAGTAFPYELCGRKGEVRLREAIAPGEVKTAGSVECRLSDAMTKARQTLRFGSNEWHFWVYPREGRCAAPAGVVSARGALRRARGRCRDRRRRGDEVRAGGRTHGSVHRAELPFREGDVQVRVLERALVPRGQYHRGGAGYVVRRGASRSFGLRDGRLHGLAVVHACARCHDPCAPGNAGGIPSDRAFGERLPLLRLDGDDVRGAGGEGAAVRLRVRSDEGHAGGEAPEGERVRVSVGRAGPGHGADAGELACGRVRRRPGARSLRRGVRRDDQLDGARIQDGDPRRATDHGRPVHRLSPAPGRPHERTRAFGEPRVRGAAHGEEGREETRFAARDARRFPGRTP